MINFLKLIRYQNLLFLAIIQILMRYTIIIPILQKYGITASEASNSNFIFLVLSTLFITAGGYILNDYFDIKIDAINKPDKQLIPTYFSKQQAMRMYQAVTIIGIISGLYLSFMAKSFTLAFIFIVVPGILWFYSASYKRQFIVGNLIVSLVTLLSILVCGITEVAFLECEYDTLIYSTDVPSEINGWMFGFAIFAFLLTWIREIIKDLEDKEGDQEMESRSMAIVWSLKKTKLFIYSLIIFTGILLVGVGYLFIPFERSLSFRYLLTGIGIPFIALIYLLFKAQQPKDFHQISTFVKFIMIIGVLYGFIFYYSIAKTYELPFFGLFIIQ